MVREGSTDSVLQQATEQKPNPESVRQLSNANEIVEETVAD